MCNAEYWKLTTSNLLKKTTQNVLQITRCQLFAFGIPYVTPTPNIKSNFAPLSSSWPHMTQHFIYQVNSAFNSLVVDKWVVTLNYFILLLNYFISTWNQCFRLIYKYVQTFWTLRMFAVYAKQLNGAVLAHPVHSASPESISERSAHVWSCALYAVRSAQHSNDNDMRDVPQHLSFELLRRTALSYRYTYTQTISDKK